MVQESHYVDDSDASAGRLVGGSFSGYRVTGANDRYGESIPISTGSTSRLTGQRRLDALAAKLSKQFPVNRGEDDAE